MYIIDKAVKSDPERRWSLPDRVFFACGACHVLASVFLEQYSSRGFVPVWLKPVEGFTGNHIVSTDGVTVFDYHGFSKYDAFMTHMHAKANRWWPGWNARAIVLPPEVLLSETLSKRYDGLWLREPGQFYRDPVPRARAFLRRYDLSRYLGAAS